MNTFENATDAMLVESYRNGDDKAFEVLLNRYKDSVYSYIRSLTNGNYTLTEEIFQETFIKAVMAIRDNQYKETGKMNAWLFTTAYRLVIDHFRRDNNDKLDFVEDIFDSAFADLYDDSIEDKIVHEQIIAETVALIDVLPAEQRQVLKMRIFEDLSFKQIAQQTNVSINTALGRMRYALINMRRLANNIGVKYF